MHVLAAQHLHALSIHDDTLLVHDVVVLQDVLAGAEVAALDLLLGIFDEAGKNARFEAFVLLHLASFVDRLHPLAAEALHEIVFEGDEEDGDAVVALTAGTAAELVIDTARFVALGADDAKPARFDDLLLFFVRLRLVSLVEVLVSLSHGLRRLIEFGIRSRKLDGLVLDALFAKALLGKIFGVAAEQNIGTAARHVGRDGDGAKAARLGDDLRLALVVLCVQDVMLDAVAAQKTGNFFRLFDGDGTHEDGLPLLVTGDDLAHDGALLALFGGEDLIVHVDTAHGTVGGDLHDVEGVDGAEFALFRFGGTRHARKFAVKTEIVLEGDGRERLVLFAHLDAFLRFDRLMQAVRIAAADHETAREFVDDDDLVVFDDVFFVEVEELVRFERLLDVVVQGDVGDIGDVLHIEEFFRLLRAEFGELHLLFLALDDIVPVEFFCLGELALPCRFTILAAPSRALFGVFEIVVEAALQGADEPVDLFVEGGRLFTLARDDKGRPRFINEDGVHLVDDGEVEFALHHEL